MSTVTNTPAPTLPDRLPGDVLARIAAEARAGLVPVGEGCFRHPTGKVKMFGAWFNVKTTLFEDFYGVQVPKGRMLIRRCPNVGCVLPQHLAVVPRSEWGRALGSRGGLWRPAA